MEKNIENLLFALWDGGNLRTFEDNNNAKGIVIYGNNIKANICCCEMPGYAKVKIEINKSGNTYFEEESNNSNFFIEYDKIKNFLSSTAINFEKEINKSFIEENGMDKFAYLKNEMLAILSQSKSEKFEFDKIERAHQHKNIIIKDKENDTTSIISIDNKQKNPLMPLEVCLNTLIHNGNKYKSASLTVLIPRSDLINYSLLKMKIQNFTEEDFLNKLIEKNNLCDSPSKILYKFSLDSQLEEKSEVRKPHKI